VNHSSEMKRKHCELLVLWSLQYSGLYYKPMTIVNDDSSVINKLEASITDDNIVVI
jgi:hypothetical protein